MNRRKGDTQDSTGLEGESETWTSSRSTGTTEGKSEGTSFSYSHGQYSVRIFLCHSSDDKPAIRTLYKRLQDDGFAPWIDEEDLLPGQNWKYEIAKAVQEADIVIVCLSHSSVNKDGFVQKEIKFALDKADEKPEEAIYIIPLKLEECPVPSRLSKWQWVNLFEGEGYKKLLRALEKKRLETRASTTSTTITKGSSATWIETNQAEAEEAQPEKPLLDFHLTPKLLCLLLLDISGSMAGEPIRALNMALKFFVSDLRNNPVTLERVELALITFGSYADIVRDFTPVYEFIAPDLSPSGSTSMGAAVELGLDLIERRKQDYKNQGVPYYQPIVLLITDGEPTDNWQAPVNRLHKESGLRQLRFITVGLENADMEFLERISPPGIKPIMLRRLLFSEMFKWLSQSVNKVSRSEPNSEVDLKYPLGY